MWQGFATGAQAPAADPASATAPPPPPRENAVLVLGARGRLGRKVVAKLLAAGRTVVAAVRDTERAAGDFAALGIQVRRKPTPFPRCSTGVCCDAGVGLHAGVGQHPVLAGSKSSVFSVLIPKHGSAYAGVLVLCLWCPKL